MTQSLLLLPPGSLSPSEALTAAQHAPSILRTNPFSISISPFTALFAPKESHELWMQYENLLMSCLRTGDNRAAQSFLERLIHRFGDENEKVMAMKGLVKEAEAADTGALDKVLQEYNAILAKNDANIPIAKRRVALLRSLGRTSQAVTSLNNLLEFTPTDAEAWSELSDIYFSQGMYNQAIFALEEVLVLVPNAWNMHARLGELQFMAATAAHASERNEEQQLAESLKRFCRSIELCDDYLRGYYGLKLVTSRLLNKPSPTSSQSVSEADAKSLTLPPRDKLEMLDEVATTKLAEIVRRHSAGTLGWRGYDPGEIEAARRLLSAGATLQVR